MLFRRQTIRALTEGGRRLYGLVHRSQMLQFSQYKQTEDMILHIS